MLIKSIQDILQGRTLYTVPDSNSVQTACEMMMDHRIGAVLVLTPDGALAGILTERDVVYRAVAAGLDVKQTPVSEVMTRDPVTVDMQDSVSDALAAKIGGKFRHLPVLENGKPAGILSFRDIPTEYRMMFERFQDLRH